MKKLDFFILKSFIGPFIAILFLVVFILMMQFLWVYIDELVGKGLGLWVIIEFMGWGGATMLPLALPLATLLASVMTIGGMSEKSELIAMKAAGISLTRVMLPLMITSVFISIGTFFAVNNLVPYSWNEIYTLRDDIKKTKEEIKIPTGIFYDGIEGYILRVNDDNKKSNMMHGVMIYDHSDNKGNTNLVLADSAMIKMSKKKDYLTFTLYNGVNYKEDNKFYYRDTSIQLQKTSFSMQELIIPLKNYGFQKSSGARFGDQVKAMKMSQLTHDIDSVSIVKDSLWQSHKKFFRQSRLMRYSEQLDTSKIQSYTHRIDPDKIDNFKSNYARKQAYQDAANKAMDISSSLKSYGADTYQPIWILKHAKVEVLKKIAEALMCLIIFFIGAPLGSFNSRKGGGMGVSIIISVLFFVLYWVVDITATKLAREGSVSAAIGAFASSIILFPIGVYLTWKAMTDSSVFQADRMKVSWKKFKTKFLSMFRKTRIVYMGTPEFAVAPLEALIKANYNVVGVVTVADKPSGRGLKMNESAVKKFAVEHNIPVLQPVKLKDPEFLEQLAALKADLFIVVAFRMLPEEVWAMPPLGTFNLHAALLPQYRGAAPINWAVINGEKITGVTTFMIDQNIDTGGIILREECRIEDTDTAGDIHDKLMKIGTDLVLETTEGLIEKSVETRVQRSFIQGSEVLKPAPKLTKELCNIDWNDSTKNIYNLIRGLSPYPAAFTNLTNGENAETVQMKIFASEKVSDIQKLKSLTKASVTKPGTVLSDGKTFFAICTEDGAISITDLQLSGKKRMDVKSFLLGFRNPDSYSAINGTSKEEIRKTLNI